MKLISSVILLLVLMALPAVLRAQEEVDSDNEIVRIETTLVSVPVVVSDRQGRFIQGLEEHNFNVYQDGQQQEIAFFADQREPINIALLLDTSYSTTDVLDEIKDAAIEFTRLLNPDDRAMIISFDTSAQILGRLTADRAEMYSAINRASSDNVSGTIMRKTVNDVISPLFADVKGRKAIILLTDGKDIGSPVSEKELLYNLEESDVMIYSVFFITELNTLMQTDPAVVNKRIDKRIPQAGVQRSERNRQLVEMIRQNNREATEYLDKMSALTAGKFYEREVTDLKATFKLILSELREQYRLGFYPPDEEVRGTVHQLRVTVDRADAVVRARKTYRSKK